MSGFKQFLLRETSWIWRLAWSWARHSAPW